MANKALATRQKMRLRVEPTSQVGKPRSAFAANAKTRAAGQPDGAVPEQAKIPFWLRKRG
jgi:hypothetical protein